VIRNLPSNFVLYSHHHQAAIKMDTSEETDNHHQSLIFVMMLNEIMAWVPINIPLKPITVIMKRQRECGLKKKANSTLERGKNQKLTKTSPTYMAETIYLTRVCSINSMINTKPREKTNNDR